MGNGNHCDFIAEITIVTEQSRQEIESYYADVEFPPARSNQQGREDGTMSGIHTPVSPFIEFLGINGDGKLLVRVRIMDYGYARGLDYRCG